MSFSDNAVSSIDGKLAKTRTKRTVYFVGIVGAQHAIAELPGNTWSKDEAEVKLETMLGKPAKTVLGPYYAVKGAQKDSDERATITVAAKDLVYTSKRFQGEYQGWKVIATGVAAVTVDEEDYEDNELISLAFEEKIDSESKARKPRMANGQLVRFDDIENVKTL